MKKIIATLVIATGLAACGDSGNPSGTPTDSTKDQLAIPDTSHGNSTPDMGNTNKSTPNISDSATPATPGRSGSPTGGSSNSGGSTNSGSGAGGTTNGGSSNNSNGGSNSTNSGNSGSKR